MIEVKEQCKKCFHFQVCANVLKQQLYIREEMLKEENPKCNIFVPAADVVQVKHAENITDLNPVDSFVCSHCGFACDDVSETINDEYGNFSHYREFEHKYCPNCGAKMDGGADNG